MELNPIKLSSNRIIDTVQVGDATVEITGYVDKIVKPEIVKTENLQFKVFKFCLNNDEGKRIQVAAWDDAINNIQHLIIVDHIIRVDGALAQHIKYPQYNIGNVSKYELIIRKNTIVSYLGKRKNLEMEPITELHKIKDYTTQCIISEAYIKSNFFEASSLDNRNITIGYGSITDGTYKVEVHIMNFTNNDYAKLRIWKGDKIRIIGIPKTRTNDIIYLSVNSINDIRRIYEQMEDSMLQEGVNYVTKSQEKRKSEETQEPHKILKST